MQLVEDKQKIVVQLFLIRVMLLMSGKNGFLLECKTKTTPSSSISIKKDGLKRTNRNV